MLNFLPKVVIWWRLKMYVWEIVINECEYAVRVMWLIHVSFLLQAIWCLKL